MFQERENSQPYMDPDAFLRVYLQESSSLLDSQWLAGSFQNLLHRALEFFLNAPYYAFAGRTAIPSGTGQREWTKTLMLLQGLARTLAKVVSPAQEITEFENWLSEAARERYTIESGANAVSLGYRVLETIVEVLSPSLPVEHPPIPTPIQLETFRRETYLCPVIKLSQFIERRLGPYLRLALLHGSLASLDYCQGFSDCDTFFIIKRDVMIEREKLIAFRKPFYQSRRFLLAIDPWQHHSHILATEQDLDFYPQTYFPLILLKSAVSFWADPPEKLTFTLRDCIFEQKVQFWRKIERLQRIACGHQALTSWYAWKHLLADVFLVPSLYLQLHGQYLDKPASLAMCRDILASHWDIVERMSQVRIDCATRINLPGAIYKSVLGLDPALVQKLYLRLTDTQPDWVIAQLGPTCMNEVCLLCEDMVVKARLYGKLD